MATPLNSRSLVGRNLPASYKWDGKQFVDDLGNTVTKIAGGTWEVVIEAEWRMGRSDVGGYGRQRAYTVRANHRAVCTTVEELRAAFD